MSNLAPGAPRGRATPLAERPGPLPGPGLRPRKRQVPADLLESAPASGDGPGEGTIMEAKVVWCGGMRFVGQSESGHAAVMDALPAVGGLDSAPRPFELLLLGLA